MFRHQTKGFCFRSSENISSKLHFCYWEISAVYTGVLEYFRFFSVLTISSRLPKIPWFVSPRPACWGEQTSDWPADRCWSYPRPGWTASASEKFKESEVSWSKKAGEFGQEKAGDTWPCFVNRLPCLIAACWEAFWEYSFRHAEVFILTW